MSICFRLQAVRKSHVYLIERIPNKGLTVIAVASRDRPGPDFFFLFHFRRYDEKRDGLGLG